MAAFGAGPTAGQLTLGPTTDSNVGPTEVEHCANGEPTFMFATAKANDGPSQVGQNDGGTTTTSNVSQVGPPEMCNLDMRVFMI